MKKLHILFLSILPALVILFCFLGFLAAPNDPEEVVITQSFLAPCAEYPLGTDQYGRCVLSRILYGGYTTLGIVLMGSAIVMTVGILLGLLLGQGKAGRNAATTKPTTSAMGKASQMPAAPRKRESTQPTGTMTTS